MPPGLAVFTLLLYVNIEYLVDVKLLHLCKMMISTYIIDTILYGSILIQRSKVFETSEII